MCLHCVMHLLVCYLLTRVQLAKVELIQRCVLQEFAGSSQLHVKSRP